LPGFKHILELRTSLFSAIRKFFRERNYLEVETPVMVHTPALELHIDAFRAGAGFLRTSPELHMKRLLAAGCERIFQIGKCFRAGERGKLHNPEFTMLEWYRANADYMDILVETRELLKYIAKACLGKLSFERTIIPRLHGGRRAPSRRNLGNARPQNGQASLRATLQGNNTIVALEKEWKIFSVEEIFKKHAGWNPVENFDEKRFDDDLVNRVEPNLPKDFPVVLKDYPAENAALARLKEGDRRVAERWELYLGGVEIANAFSELTDAVEQRKRFEECVRDRTLRGAEAYELDEDFLSALELGMPPSAGVALGLDRLVMLLAGARSLDDVLPFRQP